MVAEHMTIALGIMLSRMVYILIGIMNIYHALVNAQIEQWRKETDVFYIACKYTQVHMLACLAMYYLSLSQGKKSHFLCCPCMRI